MARVPGGCTTNHRRKKVLKQAKGYYGAKHKLYRTANEQVMNSLAYAYTDRKKRKRDFRRLWITRINAAVRPEGLSYSVFMNNLKKSGIELNRKALSELAIHQPEQFQKIVEIAKKNHQPQQTQ